MAGSEKRTKVVTKEFDESQAGQSVGFVTVEQSEQTFGGSSVSHIVEVALRVSRIGEEGAFCGYTACADLNNDKIIFGDDAGGFERLTSLEVMLHSGLNPQEAVRNGMVRIGTRARGADANRAIADVSLTQEVGTDDWLVGDDAILTGLKAGLETKDMQDFYPLVYYLLNNALLRNRYQGIVNDAADQCYADKDMAEITQAQLLRAMEITSILDAVAMEDQEMLDNLTVFSSVKASQVAKTFKKSREQVYEYETAAKEAARQLYVPDLTYLPIGQVAGGRSWPYMDADLAPDDPKSFGIVLSALQEKNVTPAVSELKRELNEVQQRAEYARTSHIMHTVLSDEEQALQHNG